MTRCARRHHHASAVHRDAEACAGPAFAPVVGRRRTEPGSCRWRARDRPTEPVLLAQRVEYAHDRVDAVDQESRKSNWPVHFPNLGVRHAGSGLAAGWLVRQIAYRASFEPKSFAHGKAGSGRRSGGCSLLPIGRCTPLRSTPQLSPSSTRRYPSRQSRTSCGDGWRWSQSNCGRMRAAHTCWSPEPSRIYGDFSIWNPRSS